MKEQGGEDGLWHNYVYRLKKENFEQEGLYKVTVFTKDISGNQSQNNDKSIVFTIDRTPPEITYIKGLEEPVVNAASLKAEFGITDSAGLKEVSVMINGKTEKTEEQDFKDRNNYNGKFVLNESFGSKKIRIIAEDLAGNITDTDSSSFSCKSEFNREITVSTNILARILADKKIIVISAVVIMILLSAFFLAKTKK